MGYSMQCKVCASPRVTKKGFAQRKQVFKCKDCGHRFFADSNFPKMRVDKSMIVVAINFYFDGMSLRRTQQNIERVLGVKVSQVTILNWVRKYSKSVNEYVQKLTPTNLSGKWHEDETMIRVEGRDTWFWEMLDEDSKFLVATHISGTRTLEDTIAIFRKGYEMSKNRPQAVFVDGSHVYNSAFNKVFYSRYKVNRVELVQRVGIRASETNNCIERQHQTLKARTKVMRGLKSMDSTKDLLTGFAVHYNFVRPHQSLQNKTPAQVAGLNTPSNWKALIEQATQSKESVKIETKAIEAIAF